MRLFYSYAHEDEELRKKLEKHLSPLRNQGAIDDWWDGDITAGAEWDAEIKERLNTADIILLLVSADFLSSDYIWRVEIEKAMQRHQAGEARVIPVILRPCDWQNSPFGKLQALPQNAKPITRWEDRDEAFLNVVEGIKKAISQATSVSSPQLDIKNSPLFSPDFLKQCEQELAHYIGPMASLILQDTLAENSQLSPPELIKALANEIPQPEQAQAFTQNLLLVISSNI
jgi:hypothetical protein